MAEITEYRGVRGLVYAKVLKDDETGYVTGPVKKLAGIAEISKTIAYSSETHFYDDKAKIIIDSTGGDEVTFQVSAIPLDVLAEITGQNYDSTLGIYMEGERESSYYAVGYITRKTNGDLVYVWRFKGKFNIPDETSTTINDGTDANGQELVFSGVETTYKFIKYNKSAKSLVVDVALGKADVSAFFDTVTTPDTLQEKTYTLTLTEGSGTSLSVQKGGVEQTTGAVIHIGDELVISVTSGTVTVNGDPFTSGDTYTVQGDTTVVSVAG